MAYYGDQKRAYDRAWVAARRSAWLLDKACVHCGTTNNLELDHIDPGLKVSHKVWTWSVKRRDVELAKCQVLCRGCHLKKTFGSRLYAHGTAKMYERYGCRCDPCREAHRQGVSDWRARRRNRPTETKSPG